MGNFKAAPQLAGERVHLEGTYFFNRDNAVEVPANAVGCQMGQDICLAIGQSH